jgi:hypothetical protein
VKGLAEESFQNHAWVGAGVVAVGLALAAALPVVPETRWAAVWGAGVAGMTGVVSLVLKRWAVRRSLQAALKAVGLVFALRAVAVGAGLYAMVSRGLPAAAFVVGFFGVYVVLQWVEVSYVLAASKRASSGGE